MIWIHEITDKMLKNAPSLHSVREHIQTLLKQRERVVFVGHGVKQDLKVMGLHDCFFVDTQSFYEKVKGLKDLAQFVLNA